MKILLAEDEPRLQKELVIGLTREGYTVDGVSTGKEAEANGKIHAYDVIVLDVMMPEKDGYAVCAALRAHGVQTPILFLTACDTVEERIKGFDSGGDDYLTKPFAFAELFARIRALMRRASTHTTDTLTLDALSINTKTHRVTINNKELPLTLREYQLLEYLMRNVGNVVTREDILEHVWDRFFDSLSNVVDVHIKNLRKKLPKIYAKRLETLRGTGYRLS